MSQTKSTPPNEVHLKNWEPTIGLEIHTQLNTKTKLFCSCPNRFGDPANQNTCEICLAHPGSLPTPNERAIEKAIQLGLAINAAINPISRFERKNYFYPDNPKAYQISQLAKPICTGGYLTIRVKNKNQDYTKAIHLDRIQIEEDAGKLIHAEESEVNESYIDFNRAGTPLLEIVSKPEINSSLEAIEYFKTLHNLLLYLDISDGNMQEGSLRADVNVSLRSLKTRQLGIRTEVKNINSFKNTGEAIEYEIKRQSKILTRGDKVEQETLLFNKKTLSTRPMRSKEDAQDYRYFIDPDILPIKVSEEKIKTIKDNLVELPAEKFTRFINEYALSEYDTWVLVENKFLADYFEGAIKIFPVNEVKKVAKKVSNWVSTEILSYLNYHQIEIREFKLESKYLGELVKLIEAGTISGKIAKTIFPTMVEKNVSPETVIKEKGIKLVSDTGELETIIKEIIDKNPEAVKKFQSGSKKIMGFFVGQVMKATKGQANPKMVNSILNKLLG